NTSPDLEASYNINELIEMEETNQLNEYTVEFYYDEWLEDSHYFLFGYENVEEEQLKAWHDEFEKEGRIDSASTSELEEKLKTDEKAEKTEILSSIHTPGKQKTKAFTYTDQKNDTAWVYRIPNEDYSKESIPFLNTELQLLIVALLVSLLIAILLSVWNGYRYGKPMFIMIRWLEAVEQKHYNHVFSEKEQRKVYKRNGKVKFRYRLYKEVIQSFSNMTTKLAQADEERKQLDKTREDWMAGISHDMRTPLSSIQGYGHILESNKYEYTSEELREIGHVIRTKSDYMVDLLNDFS